MRVVKNKRARNVTGALISNGAAKLPEIAPGSSYEVLAGFRAKPIQDARLLSQGSSEHFFFLQRYFHYNKNKNKKNKHYKNKRTGANATFYCVLMCMMRGFKLFCIGRFGRSVGQCTVSDDFPKAYRRTPIMSHVICLPRCRGRDNGCQQDSHKIFSQEPPPGTFQKGLCKIMRRPLEALP